MNRVDLQRLAETRLRESRCLLKHGEYSGAFYLAGYAVECALKACIAKQTQQHDFPGKDRVLKSHTHRPAELLRVADLESAFEAASSLNPKLGASWNIVLAWTESSRYEEKTENDARFLLEAIERPRDGVLSWLKVHW